MFLYGITEMGISIDRRTTGLSFLTLFTLYSSLSVAFHFKMKSFVVLLAWMTLVSASRATRRGDEDNPHSAGFRRATTVPTWPAVSDELEDLMFLVSGTNARGLASGVIPCSKSPTGVDGRIASAEWLRTMFHDVSTANIYQNYGGLDASLLFETDRSENIGDAFNTTFEFLAKFYNSRASASDLLALATYTATRSCGGPIVPVRTGRIDATTAGPIGVPEPQNAIGTLENQFLRINFSTADMIKATACGHTLGGVHSPDFPTIVLEDMVPNDYAFLDDTPDLFDNSVVVDYLAGNTTNPLVVGNSVDNGKNSDGRVYKSDGNVTMQALADPNVFASECSTIFQRMIEVVPPGVELGDVLTPYDVKPSSLQLSLAANASLQFTGEIRVRTTTRTASSISSVQLVYQDRNGVSSDTTITAVDTGSASGFDEAFVVSQPVFIEFAESR